MAVNLGQEFFPNGKLKRNERGLAELNMNELKNAFATTLQYMPEIHEKDIQPFNHVGVEKLLLKLGEERYNSKEKDYGNEMVRHLEKMILLTTIDQLWKDHLLAMDHLRDGVGLQGYGQKDPIVVYKKEAFRFFQMMMDSIAVDVVRKLFAVQVAPNENADDIEQAIAEEESALTGGGNFQYNLTEDGELVPTKPTEATPAKNPPLDLSHLHKAPKQMQLSRGPVGSPFAQPQADQMPMSGGGSSNYASDVDKVGRNDPCPCGSGKKYKKCHGQGT
jgi:preprotein translocase subunit SecA